MSSPYDTRDSYIKLIIPGVPLPQQRPRLFRRGTKNIVFDPQAQEKRLIKIIVQEQMEKYENEWQFPLYPRISFRFYMPIPKSINKTDRAFAEIETLKHNKKPDVDNLIKLYLDVLTGLALSDDNCASLGRAIKLYSLHPRTEIFIEESDKIVTTKELYG